MASPPERITVKRPRDEDPVEALFIQPKKQRPSCFWKLVGHDTDTPQYAAPTASIHAAHKTQTTSTASHSSKVPTVRTTLPSEDFNEREHGLTWLTENSMLSNDASTTSEKGQQLSENTQPKKPRQNTHDVFASPSKARKFHLIRSSSPISSPFLAPKTVAQKHRDKRQRDLAVFAERPEILRKAKLSGGVQGHSSGKPRVDNSEQKDKSQPDQPRKRPNATAAERKWRAATWANPPKPYAAAGTFARTAEKINEPSNKWNYESVRLAEQLQEVALEEIYASEERAKGLSASGQLKIKPKPPKTRQIITKSLTVDGGEDDLMMNSINFDNDGDFVIDTYVRSSSQPFEVTEAANPNYHSLHAIDHSNIGVLIIEDEEEEALWEAFAEDRQSDQEWNSEEEDENAEDYYGNDYPEDEVDSDDEFGRGAYKYRHAASDDEEFGSSDE